MPRQVGHHIRRYAQRRERRHYRQLAKLRMLLRDRSRIFHAGPGPGFVQQHCGRRYLHRAELPHAGPVTIRQRQRPCGRTSVPLLMTSSSDQVHTAEPHVRFWTRIQSMAYSVSGRRWAFGRATRPQAPGVSRRVPQNTLPLREPRTVVDILPSLNPASPASTLGRHRQLPSRLESLPQGDYWMRSLSFAGLHRILSAVANAPHGLTASEINDLVLNKGLTLTPNNPQPAPTTLYHYRNTLLRLQVLRRLGRKLQANFSDPAVRELLRLPVPRNGDQSLDHRARERFASLVLRNDQCRSLFFDLFMPTDQHFITADDFRHRSVAVRWWHQRSSTKRIEVILRNEQTGATARCASPISKTSIMYGVRYWARDQLQLIDEYCAPGGGSTTMFSLSAPNSAVTSINSTIMETVSLLLSLRTSADWTIFSIHDLILRCCETQRKPRTVLFGAIDWLIQEWPRLTVLIPTSSALATVNAMSLYGEDFILKRYYRHGTGPYISHIRIHKDVSIPHRRASNNVQSASETLP